LDFSELTGNMGGMAIQHWGISVGDLTWMVDDDDLS